MQFAPKIAFNLPILSLTLSLGWGLAGLPSVALPPTLSIEQQAAEVSDRLLGIMDTAAQSATNSHVANIRLTTCTVTVADLPSDQPQSATFLYQEQAPTARLTQPYRQRFLRIAPSRDRQSVQSLAFKPDHLEPWVGLCNKRDRQVQWQDLGQPVCSVFLKKSGSDYVGRTPVDGCATNFRGAMRISNRITLHESGMDTWDRGYDATGKQVWGALSDSYQFRRHSQN